MYHQRYLLRAMSEKMLKFVDHARVPLPKRPVRERVQDFDETYNGFPSEIAADQAARCSQCGIPFCQHGCPLSNNIPDWLKLTAEGRLEEAYEVSSATNPMPEICGRICPQDRLCEGDCVIENAGHGTVTIGGIERYISDTAWARGWVPPLIAEAERGQSIGIVGAGPAGLACGEYLRRLGYAVTIYDRHDRAGGLLMYGIPNFKLDKEVVNRRIQRLTEGGIEFRLGCEIGLDLPFAEIRARHDAIFLGTGVYKPHELQTPGVGLKGIEPALDFLIHANRTCLGDKTTRNTALSAKGKDVVVIGGGDTAMDCLRTAIRQGAKSVTCLYRRDRDNMPGSRREAVNAEDEGTRFMWLTRPRAFLGEHSVSAIKVAKLRLGAPDASGRRKPEDGGGEDFTLPADMVILALGFKPEDIRARMFLEDLAITDWGTVKADSLRMQTNLEGVFAGGDIVRGASLVVWAIRDGRLAGNAIHKYLQSKLHKAAE